MNANSHSLSTAIATACDTHGIVGDELRRWLSRELATKVLLRGARDVVLLTGATGVGKEKIAAACHEASRNALGRTGELVELNCANLSGGLFEGQLFGYRRGAYTGAERDFAGLAARADNGTLVLDEFQSLEPQNQARLLRFLGEREYRRVGDDKVNRCNALIILASNRDLQAMVRDGTFRRDIVDRAAAKLRVPSLFERRQDIGQLAQSFADEVARDLGVPEGSFYGLTRRARADVETAVIRFREVSVRRLREIIRDAVFLAAADSLPEAIDSEFLLPVLQRELAFSPEDRDAQDAREIEAEFDLAVGMARLHEISRHHSVSQRTLTSLCRALQALIDEMDGDARTYRNIVDRTSRLSKVALWLVSGARTQAEFRRFFGSKDAHMPTKSVAHQVFHDVFAKDTAGREGDK